MNCPSCGNALSDGAKFCGVCGTQISAAPTTAQAVSAQTQTPTPHSNYSAPRTQGAAQNQGQAYQPAAQQNAYGAAYGAASMPTSKGVLGQAWSDITSSQGWFPRILLLIVMNVVPVLSFFSSGYMLQWGADASRGKNPTMPKGTFDKNGFLTGLFYSIMSILLFFGLLWTGILNIIPILGSILAFAVSLFASAFLMLAGMRMALYNQFGKAFDLSELFRKYKTKLGSLFAAAIVPNIAFGVCVVILVLLLIAGGGAFWGSMLYNPQALLYSSSAMSTALTGIILVVFMVLLCIFFYGFAQVWAMRAVGVWVARNCPDWAEEAKQLELESIARS